MVSLLTQTFQLWINVFLTLRINVETNKKQKINIFYKTNLKAEWKAHST